MRWLGLRSDGSRPGEQRLVEEASAFLDGRYAEAVADGTTGLPVWAELNRIAHRRPAEVTARRGDGAVARPVPLGSWAWAEEAIGEELTRLSRGDGERVARLQRECLVPLELSLMSPLFGNVLPAEVVQLAVSRMRMHPAVRGTGRAPAPPRSGA
jgi:hypothetical protein